MIRWFFSWVCAWTLWFIFSRSWLPKSWVGVLIYYWFASTSSSCKPSFIYEVRCYYDWFVIVSADQIHGDLIWHQYWKIHCVIAVPSIDCWYHAYHYLKSFASTGCTMKDWGPIQNTIVVFLSLNDKDTMTCTRICPNLSRYKQRQYDDLTSRSNSSI
jgi:hypothetical protein